MATYQQQSPQPRVGVASSRVRFRSRRQPIDSRPTMVGLIAPSVVLLILINLYPIVFAGNQAVHDGSLIGSGPFVGLDNFVAVFQSPAFWNAAVFTLIFAICGVFGSWLLGLGLALMLNAGVVGGAVYKVLLLLPWIIPIVVSATSWNWLVATSDSPIPSLFHAIGLGTPQFLADPILAKVMVCIFEIWINFPFMMLMASSALTAVDASVYEAARMDGASPWQQFIHMTMPLVARSTYISWILMAIFCVNDFPTVFLLTGGGPAGSTTTLVVLAYQTVFHNLNTGPGVAIAFLMTVVLAAVAVVLYSRVQKAHIE